MQKLTARQLKFVSAYLVKPCAASAARAAGYSPKGAKVAGCRLLTNVNLQVVLAAKRAEFQNQFEIDKKRVVSELKSSIEVAKEKLDAGSMIRGWSEIAKMLGLYAPEKIQLDAAAGDCGAALVAKYEAMSDEELEAIIEGQNAVSAGE
jgi:phage terminase small subunit